MGTKKLSKVISGTTLTIGVEGTELVFDLTSLPEAIIDRLKMHGLSQLLGDAAAGREGSDAIDSINKRWNNLEEGNWVVRTPAGEKITKSGILEKFNLLGPKEQAIARGLLEKLGILPPAA